MNFDEILIVFILGFYLNELFQLLVCFRDYMRVFVCYLQVDLDNYGIVFVLLFSKVFFILLVFIWMDLIITGFFLVDILWQLFIVFRYLEFFYLFFRVVFWFFFWEFLFFYFRCFVCRVDFIFRFRGGCVIVVWLVKLLYFLVMGFCLVMDL